MDGRLCGDQTAWSRIRIPSATRVRITYNSPSVVLRLIAPNGADVATLTPGRQCLALDMEPGVWVLAATPAPGNTSHRSSGFELFFDRVR